MGVGSPTAKQSSLNGSPSTIRLPTAGELMNGGPKEDKTVVK